MKKKIIVILVIIISIACLLLIAKHLEVVEPFKTIMTRMYV